MVRIYPMKPNGFYRKPVDDVDNGLGAIEEVTTDRAWEFRNPARVAGLKRHTLQRWRAPDPILQLH